MNLFVKNSNCSPKILLYLGYFDKISYVIDELRSNKSYFIRELTLGESK